MVPSLKLKLTLAVALLICLTAFTVSTRAENSFGIPSFVAPGGPTGGEERCLQCHQGIEEISRSHPLPMGGTACHGGNGASEGKAEAIVKPSTLTTAEASTSVEEACRSRRRSIMSSTRGLANGGIQYRIDLARVNIRANQVRAVLYHFDLYLPAGAATYLDYR